MLFYIALLFVFLLIMVIPFKMYHTGYSSIKCGPHGRMKLHPRQVGRIFIGRFMLLRVVLATIVLTESVIGSIFWLRSLGLDKHNQLAQNALTFNFLYFGAISCDNEQHAVRLTSQIVPGGPLGSTSFAPYKRFACHRCLLISGLVLFHLVMKSLRSESPRNRSRWIAWQRFPSVRS